MLAIVFLILLLIALAVVLFDFWDDFQNWFWRIKIGRISDDAKWLECIRDIDIKWLSNGAPRVSEKEGQRLKLIKLIKNRGKQSLVCYWQDASLLKGISEDCSDDAKEAADKLLERYIDIFTGEWKENPVSPDAATLAYEFMNCRSIDNAVIEPAMTFIAEMLKEKSSEYGTVPYNSEIPDIRFVDTVGMICPFLIRYANEYKKYEYIDIAVKQINEYRKFGFDDRTGLPFHCFNAKTEAQLGIIGWGRGCGWWAVGIADSLKELLKCDGLEKEKVSLLKLNINFLDEMKKYIRGGTVNRMVLNESLSDSSASAMLSYCCAYIYLLTGKKEYSDISGRITEYLKGATRRNGVIDYSQGDTMGIGYYSSQYCVMPAAQGFALAASALMK